MISAISEWVLRLTGAALLGAAALAVTPEGRTKKAVALVCGFVVVTAFLSIALRFDTESFSKSMAQYRADAAAFAAEANGERENLTRFIIEGECAAYISDKGNLLGVEKMTVSVRAVWSEEGYWYPYSADISGSLTETQREKLSYYIEAELGIPEKMQNWRDGDEG